MSKFLNQIGKVVFAASVMTVGLVDTANSQTIPFPVVPEERPKAQPITPPFGRISDHRASVIGVTASEVSNEEERNNTAAECFLNYYLLTLYYSIGADSELIDQQCQTLRELGRRGGSYLYPGSIEALLAEDGGTCPFSEEEREEIHYLCD